MQFQINGIQQVGIGVADAAAAFAWYKRYLGFSTVVFEDRACARLMTRYTGGHAEERYAVLAMNMQGGGGLEIWQYTSRKPAAAPFEVCLGDAGVFAIKLRSKNIEASYQHICSDAGARVSPIAEGPEGKRLFYVRDPFGNWFQVMEDAYWFTSNGHPTGGVCGVVVGVSNIEKAVAFYQGVLGYDRILFDGEAEFDELKELPGGAARLRRLVLGHRKTYSGAFSRLLGPTTVELVQTTGRQPNKIFENRYWGDLGFIHVCFDINGMKPLQQACDLMGHCFTVNSEDSFDMGKAAGHFCYNEDPDGTLIEYVETHKVPILKKFGWYLDLRKRKKLQPLPDWMIRCMGLGKKTLELAG